MQGQEKGFQEHQIFSLFIYGKVLWIYQEGIFTSDGQSDGQTWDQMEHLFTAIKINLIYFQKQVIMSILEYL